MIINYQAFAAKGTANRRIYEELDELQSRRPIDVIKSVRPILIIDEPQKFGDKTESLFEEFNPLLTIRYSATHKKNKEYNKVYRLDAIDAYNQKLVKKINVKGIEILNNKSEDTYLFLDSVNISDKKDPQALMEIEVKTSTGTTRRLIRIKAGDDLYTKSGYLTPYKGYVVSEIDGRYEYDKVCCTNGVEITVGQAFGDVDQNQIIRIQIRETIRSHFEKERELYNLGIKVLSLFFIDEVKKVRDNDTEDRRGEYLKIFDEEYVMAIEKYREKIEKYKNYFPNYENVNLVREGYFALDKKKNEVEVDDWNSDKGESAVKTKSQEDIDRGIELILEKKDELISFNEPLTFIFSHSALREGWDNPNVFTLCTLKNGSSDIAKKQEIGRGLRLPVDVNGNRSLDKNVNELTVIANDSYENFSRMLQEDFNKNINKKKQQIMI